MLYLYEVIRKGIGHHCECACAGGFLECYKVHSTKILISIGLYIKEHTRKASTGAETKYNCEQSQWVSLQYTDNAGEAVVRKETYL